jgi:hypothetical protein
LTTKERTIVQSTISGGCTRGPVRYETKADLIASSIAIAGTANAAPARLFRGDGADGERGVGSRRAALLQNSGQCRPCRRARLLPACGSGHDQARGHARGARHLDDPALFKPALDIFTDSSQPWTALHAETQKCRKDANGCA